LDQLGLGEVPDGRDDIRTSAFGWVLFALLACVYVAAVGGVAIRALRRGVEVSEAGCTVRYVFGTERIPWADIQRFAVDKLEGNPGFPKPYGCCFERFDGQMQDLPLGSWSSRSVEKATRWLNEQRRILDKSKA